MGKLYFQDPVALTGHWPNLCPSNGRARQTSELLPSIAERSETPTSELKLAIILKEEV